jgi:heptosyltransferase-2
MKILVIQNKMGIGDMVIYLPFIEAISKKFNTPVSILVKESSKAEQFLKDSNIVNKIIILERNSKIKNGRHEGLTGFYNLIKDLKQYSFDKAFIFNSSFRFNLITRVAGIKDIYQYPLLKKRDQHVIRAAKELLKKNLDLNVESNPEISINNKSVQEVKTRYKINNNEKNILLGIGGSGTTKRIPAIIFIKLMHLITKKYKCKFFLATGKDNQEQKILKEILDTEFKNECYALDNLDLTEILPIIKNCDVSICNDSSFSHLSSGLGVKTIVLMADTPLVYGSYSPRMYPIIPDGENTVAHDTLGKDRINPNKIFDQLNIILG